MKGKKGYYAALCAIVLVGGGFALNLAQNRAQSKQSAQTQPVTKNTAPNLQASVEQRQQRIEEEEKQQDTKKQESVPSAKKKNVEEYKANPPKPSVTPSEKTPAPQQQITTQNSEAEISEDYELAFQTPVDGEIVMEFSMEHGIYDATLEQYRTNDCISIAAKKGEPVKASENGTVQKIDEDEERGKTVSILHKDGWVTTYSQLEEDVFVSEGDKVKKGQQIGTVASPTKYGIALGDHVDFALIKDGLYVDPVSMLAD